jgi:hypothetical protein
MSNDPKRVIITGVPPYKQDDVVKGNGNEVIAGCGPVAALMLLAYYDRRYGYKQLVSAQSESITGMPDALLIELRQSMHTVNDLKNGTEWGMTIPGFFKSGLDAYITNRYGKTDLDSYSTKGLGTNLDDVFDKSVALINSNKVHFLLFDWHGSSGIFPNHYVVVVGYRKDGGRKELVVNAGWGYDFQIVDMSDKSVKPGTIYWIDSIEGKPEGPADGHQIGPKSGYTWTTVSGKQQLTPKLNGHFDSGWTSWDSSDETQDLVRGTEVKRCTWY